MRGLGVRHKKQNKTFLLDFFLVNSKLVAKACKWNFCTHSLNKHIDLIGVEVELYLDVIGMSEMRRDKIRIML